METKSSLPASADLNNKEVEAVRPLIRLLPHTIDSLPPHPALSPTISAQNNGEAPHQPDRLLSFARTLLAEAVAFTDDYLPREFTSKSLKPSPPATAKVELLEHIRRQRGNEETWFARRSIHADRAAPGTATFAELDAGLRHEHSLHEMQYTPDVFDAHEVLSWDSELASLLASSPPMPSSSSTSTSASPSTSPAVSFTDISMRVYEMCHALPTPLQPRVFSVLVATAKTTTTTTGTATAVGSQAPDAAAADGDGFIVVQIPLDIKSVPAAFYSNGRNIKEGLSPEKRKEVVIGIYTSIERGRRYGHHHHRRGGGGAAQAGDGDGDGDGDGHQSSAGAEAEGKGETEGETEWLMATASDARGVLPMWMQKMGTPGAVVKDVGLFMKWVQEKR